MVKANRESEARALAAVLLAALLLYMVAPAQAAEAPASAEELRADFNRDAGKVRLLLLLDPT